MHAASGGNATHRFTVLRPQSIYWRSGSSSQDSLDAADRVTEDIRRDLTKLADMPGIGHQRDDVPKQYRVWSVYSYLIIYRYDEVRLTVVRIVHGARRMRPLFRRKR